MVTEIISEMKDPAEFPKAYIKMSVPFQGFALLISGIGAYVFMGDQVNGMVGDNIPFGATFRVAAACLFAHMLVTFLIKNVVISRAIHNLFDHESVNEDTRRGWQGWTLIVVVVMGGAWLLANIVPFFSALVDLLGSTLTPVSCFIMPILLYIRWTMDQDDPKHRISYLERVIICAELALAILITVMGTYYAVDNLMQNWHAFGLPFECHCEKIWKTCECSGSQPGMEQCLVSPPL